MMEIFMIVYFLTWGFGVFLVTQIVTGLVNIYSKQTSYLKIIIFNLLIIIPAQIKSLSKFYLNRLDSPTSNYIFESSLLLSFIFYINILISLIRHKIFIKYFKEKRFFKIIIADLLIIIPTQTILILYLRDSGKLFEKLLPLSFLLYINIIISLIRYRSSIKSNKELDNTITEEN